METKTMKKTDNIFRWIILGIFVAHILTYFMPIYESIYTSSYSDPETTLYYMYMSGPYFIVNLSSLLIPIVAIVFLFANFKNSKLFFFGFSATYLLNCIFTILSLSKITSDNSNSYYEYSLKYGYYLYIVTMALLAVVIISAFIIYLVRKSQDKKEEPEQSHQSPHDSKIDNLRKRIDLLDDLKNQGILTENEYEEKRADIIKELKV